MNRYERVVQILDAAVGGPTAPVGFHSAFWRQMSRDEFVTRKVFGLPLITIGDGRGSNLIKSLKGEEPFGADLDDPPANATFNRMPSGRPPVPAEDIGFIERWIDDGCPEDDIVSQPTFAWRRTNAPVASYRTDDIWFADALTGWAVNSDGNIVKTTDGGETWVTQHAAPGVFLRCVGFANASIGWVGTLTRNRRLFRTNNGGATWSAVSPLPEKAPIAICGLAVVSDQIVFASGTNRPADVPAMMKTVDGGKNWTAWEMTGHASILIDTFFEDALHGWVVGGKSDEGTPTTREKLKPVVLETTDGGTTWTNRLAGMEDQFPLGEWGWKIQFLQDRRFGFVALENFNAGAILKTVDSGRTWTRVKINDAQGNANLEGIGFIDERRGWVGGWGSADFKKGSSSSTSDSGENWLDANEIGKFINRFRFVGNPIQVGYASGDTVYKYSSDPLPAPGLALAAVAPARPLLPDVHIRSANHSVPIRMSVPPGTRRLTLQAWTRFGEEVGYILDEIRPAAGEQTFLWDGRDSGGKLIEPGDFILRLTADDQSASSVLSISAPIAPRPGLSLASVAAPATRPASVAELMEASTRDLEWLKSALQTAIQLELATLPPYLTARWTVKQPSNPIARSIFVVRGEEMLHFGLACNLLVAIGGSPAFANEDVAPKYPGPLPGGVRPGLVVALRKLDREQARVFMEIEYPQGGPIALMAAGAETFDSIGEFYQAVLKTFEDLNPVLSLDRQLEGSPGVFKVDSLDQVRRAIELINRQGEGSSASPEEAEGDLAHYYRFGEIYHGKRLVKDADGHWSFTGDPLVLNPADVHDMADIPPGGYDPADVPDLAARELITRFDQTYSNMLRQLESSWVHGDQNLLMDAVISMGQMATIGRQLIQKPLPNGPGNYGPCFRYVP